MTEKNRHSSKAQAERRLLEDRKVALLTVFEIVKAKRYFFYLTIVLTLAGTLLGHYLKVPTYQAHATLFVQDNDQHTAAEYLLNKASYRSNNSDRIQSYINHLNSDTFLLRVAEKIKFDKEFQSLNIATPNSNSPLALGYWKKKLFKDQNGGLVSDREQKLLMPIEQIAGFVRSVVKYQSDYNSQFIAIQVKTLDGKTSQWIANLIADEFVEITNLNNMQDISDVEKFVAQKKIETEKQVRDLDRQLVEFKKRNKMISTDLTTQSYARRLADLEQSIQNAELQLKEKNKILEQLATGRSKQLKKIFRDGSKSENLATDETVSILQSRIDQLKKEKSAYLSQGVEESNWRIRKINEDIDLSIQRLKSFVGDPQNTFAQLDPQKAQQQMSELNSELQTIKARITTLRNAKKQLQSQIEVLPSMEQEFINLENKFKLEVDALSHLERKEKELEIQRISFKKEIRVDQRAELPGPSSRGSILLKVLFSSFAAIFLGLLIILGLESLDPSIKSRQDLYDCGLEFFGEIPLVEPKNPKKRRGKFQFGNPNDLVCKNTPDSVESMSFKYIRARIESMRYKENKDCQIITVSSALHNEGKSFVAANLSLSLSQLNRKVLLIDGDLRRPSQSAYFGLSAKSGLTDLLSMRKDLEEVLEKDVANNLHILPAGFSGVESSELISSHKFRLLIEHLRDEYDYIVIDTPPTFAVVDAAVVASFSDIPILVASFRETRKADLYEAYNDLLQVSYKNVFGVINKAIVANSRIHYYGYPIYDKANEVSAFQKGPEDDSDEFLKKLKKRSS